MYKYILSFFFFLLTVSSFSQDTKEEIQKKQQQLLKEISDLNSTLDGIKKNKKLSIGQLTLVQRKIDARQELINNINKDLRRLNEDMYQNELNIYRLKKELDTLKEQYAKSLVFAYKNRSNYDYLNFLFSANAIAASRTHCPSSCAFLLAANRCLLQGPFPFTTDQNSSQSISPKS